MNNHIRSHFEASACFKQISLYDVFLKLKLFLPAPSGLAWRLSEHFAITTSWGSVTLHPGCLSNSLCVCCYNISFKKMLDAPLLILTSKSRMCRTLWNDLTATLLLQCYQTLNTLVSVTFKGCNIPVSFFYNFPALCRQN